MITRIQLLAPVSCHASVLREALSRDRTPTLVPCAQVAQVVGRQGRRRQQDRRHSPAPRRIAWTVPRRTSHQHSSQSQSPLVGGPVQDDHLPVDSRRPSRRRARLRNKGLESACLTPGKRSRSVARSSQNCTIEGTAVAGQTAGTRDQPYGANAKRPHSAAPTFKDVRGPARPRPTNDTLRRTYHAGARGRASAVRDEETPNQLLGLVEWSKHVPPTAWPSRPTITLRRKIALEFCARAERAAARPDGGQG